MRTSLWSPHASSLSWRSSARPANLVLVNDENIILECLRHVQGNGQRRSLHIHTPPMSYPPRRAKRDPRSATENGIRVLVEEAAPTLARALVAAYDGISPQIGREVAARVLGDPNAPLGPHAPFKDIADTLALLARGEERRPCIARDNEGRIIAFAPYWLHQFAHVEAQPSINAAAELVYAEAEQLTGHSQRRAAVLRELEAAAGRVRRRVDALRAELERAGRIEQLRWEGEMIYGFLHEIRPGQRKLVVEGQTIALDPNLSGVENAQARFREYEKAKGALAGVPQRLEEAESELAYLSEAQALLELAERYEEIEQIAAEAQERGFLRRRESRRARPPRSTPLRLRGPGGALSLRRQDRQPKRGGHL
ncbi:MAG: hypothetical protein KatS3mg057_1137 [Herpetosiphonaceae bacterium]|nr:MAG: hypothetical protein KatS3mg057_1137 [Herpetosiphonaceae bacterium]